MKNLSVLICEDEKLIALDLQMTLMQQGYKVLGICETAEEFIKKTLELKPDILLTDIRLKGETTGIDAIKKLKQLIKIPFFYVSGQGDESTIRKALETNPCGFITKPFNSHQIKNAVDKCALALN
jgi:DNA-binding NarL/FixJ family response regulator